MVSAPRWRTTLGRVILPNIRVAALSGAFLTLAIVMGEFTIASLSAFHTFPTYLQQINQSKAYPAAAATLMSFMITWAAMLSILLIGRRGGQRHRARGDRPVVAHARRAPGAVALVRPRHRPPGHRPRARRRGVRLAARPERLRQDDGAAARRRLRPARRGQHPRRRQGHHAACRPTAATWGWSSRPTASSRT